MAKPFPNYPALLEQEGHSGADLGYAYRTPDSEKCFSNGIARSQLWCGISAKIGLECIIEEGGF